MMKTNKVAPSLTLIAGTGVLVPGRPQTPGQPDRKIIAAGQQIEALLPALAKIHRDWARGARAAHAYCDANFPPPAFDDKADSPRSLALDLKYETTGARLADEAMSILNEKIEPLAEAIGSANAR